MERTTNFFVIDNYNTIPKEIMEYCSDYIIYDASTNEAITEELKKACLKYKKIPRTGHNISTYFSYFQDNYDKLPEVMCLTKGHMIGRHCSKEYFDRVYKNKYFTFLYEDRSIWEKVDKDVWFLASENKFLEINNSWYVGSPEHPHKFFINANDLLKFIYKTPLIPKYFLFSPGACYIVTKEQVLKHTSTFYHNLNKIMTYGLNPNFPSEAHMVERILPIIFDSNYEENEWMNDERLFELELEKVKYKVVEYDEEVKKIKGMNALSRKIYNFRKRLIKE